MAETGAEECAPLRMLEWGRDLDAARLAEGDIAFLEQLGGPAFISIPGADPTRSRIVTTLLHGNEPSGVRAMLRWLKRNDRPATDTLFFVASVQTALAAPHFAHRQLPGRRDLNRCFGAGDEVDDAEGRLARAALRSILDVEPDCLIDLHNNTGHNPAYGVAVALGEAERELVALFADRVVHAPLALGTIVEATVPHFPSVTIECGRSGDPTADDIAYRGLCEFLRLEDPTCGALGHRMLVLEEPIRVCVADGVDLTFAEERRGEAALTISSDIDRHNFVPLPAGACIGWVDASAPWPLIAHAPDGRECSREMFEVRAGELRTLRDFTPIMMTTRPEIAKSDCLFYAADTGASEGGQPGA